jgi:mannose-1-phosphate guanylyltransferase
MSAAAQSDTRWEQRLVAHLLDDGARFAPRPDVAGVVLCAGMGTRMGALTKSVPKPLLPVLNGPLLWWSLGRMRPVVGRVALNVHHLPEAFVDTAGLAEVHGLRVDLVRETSLTGPLGGVLACRHALAQARDVLVLAGDGLYDADLARMIEQHRRSDAELTIGTASVADGSQYGVVSTDARGRVTRMREKPPGVGPTPDASCGVYVVSRHLVERFAPAIAPLDWIDVVPTLLAEGAEVRAARVQGWHDIGSPRGLLETNLALLAGPAVSRVARRLHEASASVWFQGADAPDVAGVRFEGRVLLGEGVELGPRALLHDAVIGHGARIGADAVVRDAVVLPGSRVPAGSVVHRSVWS